MGFGGSESGQNSKFRIWGQVLKILGLCGRIQNPESESMACCSQKEGRIQNPEFASALQDFSEEKRRRIQNPEFKVREHGRQKLMVGEFRIQNHTWVVLDFVSA